MHHAVPVSIRAEFLLAPALAAAPRPALSSRPLGALGDGAASPPLGGQGSSEPARALGDVGPRELSVTWAAPGELESRSSSPRPAAEEFLQQPASFGWLQK
ncbi:unnamed protein product [Prorocentrum cordatum]|uniref:Uncharacterized protein n=1 Tax=Prorocentrum cordatum TaxID=2364126 RepID=A0ABN9SZD6_9DINO|nr:unnamed protein product [Polarella glacialis]